MADSNDYRRWIDETRNEQRILRDNGCYGAADRLQSGLNADYVELSRAMDLEDRQSESDDSDSYDDHG